MLKTLKNIILIISIAVLLVLLWDVFFFSASFGYFFGFLFDTLNVNIWHIRAIAVIITLVYIFYFIPNLTRAFNPLLPKKEREKSAWIFGIQFVIFCLCIAPFHNSMNFNADGESTVCIAWNGTTYEKVPCNWKAHRKYGSPTINVTANNVGILNFKKIIMNKKTAFFDPLNGKPIIFYGINNGELEFFNMEGFHPTNGEKLMPVKKETIRELKLTKSKDSNLNKQIKNLNKLLNNY